MPKVEIHLHLEGAFNLEMLFRLIQKYGGEPSVKNIDDLKKRFVFKDFSHFIEMWLWKNRFFREGLDFEESTYYTLKNLSEQNVIYIEAFFSPWDFRKNEISTEEITESTILGIERAEKDFGIQCNLIADLSRESGYKEATYRLDEITPYLGNKVIGIGLGGDEQRYFAELFEDVFKEAKKRGFHLTAHAGEAMGSESVWAAIQKLKVERIGHGVRSIEDANLIEFLKQNQIPLEVCITSNLKTGIYPSIKSHPITQFVNNGLLVTINSDDPTMFGSTITDEYLLLINELNFSLPEIKKIAVNAINASFAANEGKIHLRKIMNEFWQINGLS